MHESVSFERWRRRVQEELEGADFDSVLVRTTSDGIHEQPLYVDRPDDDPGWPGLPPFVRGTEALPPQRSGRQGPAAVQRYDEQGTRRLREAMAADLAGGTDGVALAFEAALRKGVEPTGGGPDFAQGAALYQVSDWLDAFEGLNPERFAIALAPGGNAVPVAATLAASLGELRTDARRIDLSFGFDPVSAVAFDGALPADPERLFDEAAALLRACRTSAPNARVLRASSSLPHNGGASNAEEIAWTISAVTLYLRAFEARGVEPEESAASIDLACSLGRDTLMGVVKLRALRLLWSRLLRACGIARPPRPRIHVETSLRVMTRRDPWVNLLRGAGSAAAAAIGGADSIATRCLDELHHDPSELARRIARNTVLVLGCEGGLGRVADPLGGAYAVETLTHRLAEKAWAIVREVDAEGGILAALRSGSFQARIAASAAERARRFAVRELAIVGTSRHPLRDEPPPPPPPALIEPDPHERLGIRMKARIEPRFLNVDGPIDFGALVDAAADGATVFELGRMLRGDAALHDGFERIPIRRDAEPFEALRDRGEALADRRVRLVPLGPPAEHRARRAFAAELFAVAGLELREDAAGTNGRGDAAPKIACLCGSDERYAGEGAALAVRAREEGAVAVALAGRGGAKEDALRAAGVDVFLHEGADVVAALDRLLTRLDQETSA